MIIYVSTKLILTIINKYHNEILCNCILRLVLTMVVQSVTLQIQGTNVRTKTNKQSRTNERMGYRNEDTLCRNDGMRYDN